MFRRSVSRLCQLLLIFSLLGAGICLLEPLDSSVEAARGRGRKSTRARRSGRRSMIRRAISKRRVPSRNRRAAAPTAIAGNYAIAPDRIEVIEHHAADHPVVRRLLDPPRPAAQTARSGAAPTESRRRVSTRIDGERVVQIQSALQSRGVYEGEATGSYDESTINAMREFQRRENIPVTGYPTAHALKRLGLAR